jgi:hypothetical protein
MKSLQPKKRAKRSNVLVKVVWLQKYILFFWGGGWISVFIFAL